MSQNPIKVTIMQSEVDSCDLHKAMAKINPQNIIHITPLETHEEDGIYRVVKFIIVWVKKEEPSIMVPQPMLKKNKSGLM